jgi:hypothetical protein
MPFRTQALPNTTWLSVLIAREGQPKRNMSASHCYYNIITYNKNSIVVVVVVMIKNIIITNSIICVIIIFIFITILLVIRKIKIFIT